MSKERQLEKRSSNALVTKEAIVEVNRPEDYENEQYSEQASGDSEYHYSEDGPYAWEQTHGGPSNMSRKRNGELVTIEEETRIKEKTHLTEKSKAHFRRLIWGIVFMVVGTIATVTLGKSNESSNANTVTNDRTVVEVTDGTISSKDAAAIVQAGEHPDVDVNNTINSIMKPIMNMSGYIITFIGVILIIWFVYPFAEDFMKGTPMTRTETKEIKKTVEKPFKVKLPDELSRQAIEDKA